MISAGTKGERNWEIFRLRTTSRLTYRQIGERYGIGPERTRQICVKMARLKRMEMRQKKSEESEEAVK